MRLFHATGKERYRDLAQYLSMNRGKNPDFFKEEKENGDGIILVLIRRIRNIIRALHP